MLNDIEYIREKFPIGSIVNCIGDTSKGRVNHISLSDVGIPKVYVTWDSTGITSECSVYMLQHSK